MKATLLIIFLSASYSNGSSNLDDIIEDKCISNGLSRDHFINTFTDFYDCINHGFKSEAPHPIQKHKKFCTYLREEYFYGCIKNFTTTLLPCLDESETYLEHFILHAIHSGYNEICGPEGLYTMIYIDDKINRSSECISSAEYLYIFSRTCLSELIFFKNLDNGVMNLSKQNICFDLDSLKSCSINLIKDVCNAVDIDEDFSKVADILYQPVLEQCNDFIESSFN